MFWRSDVAIQSRRFALHPWIASLTLAMTKPFASDDELMAQALKLTGLPTKRAVVEEGLRLMVRLRKQARALKSLKGLGWEGDLDEMRRDRPSRPS